MKHLYKPIALISSLLSKKVGKNAFQSVWSKIDEDKSPGATSGEGTMTKVVGAAALEAAIMAATAAAASRGSARAFHYLTGVWPGAKPEKDSDEEQKEDGD
jgi:Protein of unknown function (DUF4235)